MAIADSPVTFPALDGLPLAGNLFRGEGSGPAVLLSSAAAIERRFYRHFAQHLLESGAGAVLTYDYRGVGDSPARPAKGAKAFRMKDWGVLDFPGALDCLSSHARGAEIVGVGHSYGGLAIGLSGVADRFARYAMVASLNGYFRRTREPIGIFAKMNFIGLPISLVLGRIPGAVGLGVGMPGSVFRDFARWCRRPDFFFGDPGVPESARFTDVKGKLLSVGIADDPWGTPEAVAALLRHFTTADLGEIWIDPAGGKAPIRHMGFFRRGQAAHWPALTGYLIDGDWPVGATRLPTKATAA